MSKLGEAVHSIADELLRTRGSAHPLEVRELVKKRHADLVDKWAVQLIDQRLLDMSRNALRPSADDQQQLPGFGLISKTFTVPDGEGEVRYVIAAKATLGDEAADLAVKEANHAAVTAQLEAAKTRHRRLWSVRGANENMLVEEAVRRLNGGGRS